MNKLKIISLTASLVLAITFTLSCEDKEAKTKPAEANTVAAVTDTAVTAPPPETAEKTVPDKRETFTDSRDGKTYKKVTIGKQTWMAENMNYEAKGSKCYENKPDYCAKYGRLYDWETALKACPKGWHLSNNNEWTELMNFLASSKEDVLYEEYEESGEFYLKAGKYLKSKSGWRDNSYGVTGTDEFGFSALPGGLGLGAGGYFDNVGDSGLWWSASEDNSGSAYSRSMGYTSDDVHIDDGGDEFTLFSVRCIQD
jgi:uncharacterized protein (TIGR02145 family)